MAARATEDERLANAAQHSVTIAGLIALATPVSADSPFLSGTVSSSRGTAINSSIDGYSGSVLSTCKEALSDRRAWSWPLFAGGIVLLIGGLVVRRQPPPAAN